MLGVSIPFLAGWQQLTLHSVFGCGGFIPSGLSSYGSIYPADEVEKEDSVKHCTGNWLCVCVLLEIAVFIRELTTLCSASVVAIYKVTRLSELASRDFSCITPLSSVLRQ